MFQEFLQEEVALVLQVCLHPLVFLFVDEQLRHLADDIGNRQDALI